MRTGSVPLHRVVVLDTETTGLDPQADEILSLSILNGNGAVLFDELIRPVRHNTWPRAQELHGISPETVRCRLPWDAHRAIVSEILETSMLVVGYNIGFDMAFLRQAGLDCAALPPTFDVMREFGRTHGLTNRRTGSPRRIKLVDCAHWYGISFEPHSSLADARATLGCYRGLMAERERRRAL